MVNQIRLLVGKKLILLLKKELHEKNNSIIKFSVPVTKSTTIEITKNEENEINIKKNYY